MPPCPWRPGCATRAGLAPALFTVGALAVGLVVSALDETV
ncbi:hypothetical protein HNR68_004178 [Saccharopolyspora hordei]|uniref:Uncharacterized protein n=1 Tax=Saccharopolyspora hordei TaxID=1838 RepID=A0A853AN39_9PSEU|nr:hypothetical protein [Saccharopolyspora hordei]